MLGIDVHCVRFEVGGAPIHFSAIQRDKVKFQFILFYLAQGKLLGSSWGNFFSTYASGFCNALKSTNLEPDCLD